MTSIGLGSFLAVINVRYRDVPYAVPYLVQLWLFASGRHLRGRRAPAEVHDVCALNPDDRGDQRVPLGGHSARRPHRDDARPRSVMTVVIFLFGLWFYFRRAEPRFADTIYEHGRRRRTLEALPHRRVQAGYETLRERSRMRHGARSVSSTWTTRWRSSGRSRTSRSRSRRARWSASSARTAPASRRC